MPDTFPFSDFEPEYLTRKVNYGGGITKYTCVGLDASGFAVAVHANAPANHPPVAIALQAIADGAIGVFYRRGIVTDATFSFVPGRVYLDNTGQPTQNIALLDIIVCIGYAVTTTSFFFHPPLFIIRLNV